MHFVFEALCFPVLLFFCWFEGGIFPDGSVRVLVEILDIFRTDAIGEVGGELPLKAGKCILVRFFS